MTPAARIAAAAEVLDTILQGTAAEKALTNWARGNRFAGSGDRAAIRDHVFQALRCKRSYAALGGAMTGRGLMLGALRDQGIDPATLFTGARHAPPQLSPDEAAAGAPPATLGERLDLPDWILPLWQQSLGAQAEPIALALRQRAPAHLRVNIRKATVPEAIAALAQEGIAATPHPLAATALQLGEGARKLARSAPYLDGRAELQDAASQAVANSLPLTPGMRVLDYCAGGGGKSLALAARADIDITAHDANPARMKDLPARAARAGTPVTICPPEALAGQGGFDLVLVDAPCSGSGAWRRSPEGKWALDAAALDRLTALQAQILDAAAPYLAPGGLLAYATCSLLAPENSQQIQTFCARSGARLLDELHLTPLDGGDGFYLAQMRL